MDFSGMNYPEWISDPKPLEKSLNEALGRLIAYMSQIEFIEIMISSRLLAKFRKGTLAILKILKDDIEHLTLWGEYCRKLKLIAPVNEELDYAAGVIERVKDEKSSALILSILIKPTVAAMSKFLSNGQFLHERMSSIYRDEISHINMIYNNYPELRELEEKIMKFIEYNATILFSLSAADDISKFSIASVYLNKPVSLEAAMTTLKDLYRLIDDYRVKSAALIFGSDSDIIKLLRNYGLSGYGLC